MAERRVVFLDPSEVDGEPLRAACVVALGDPDVIPWMEDEVERVRQTIAAYLDASFIGGSTETCETCRGTRRVYRSVAGEGGYEDDCPTCTVPPSDPEARHGH